VITGIDLSKINKILIIMMGGIGNMIFLTPALKALRQACPSAKIHFLFGPYGAEKAIEGSNLIDERTIVDPVKQKGIADTIRLIQKLREEKFSLSISSTGINPLKSGLLCYFAGIKYRLGEKMKGKGFFYNLKTSFDRNSHEVESNISLIKKLGIEVKDKSLYIHMSADDKNFARETFAYYDLEGKLVIGIHPGSGIHQAGFKRWPKERFARVADSIMDNYNASVILFGGTEEIELANDIKALMKSNPLIMTGKTTLNEAAAMIAKCGLFISNDSGLLHVACAANTPAVAIFGPTNYKKTGPYSDSSIIVRKELDCSPCYTGEEIKCKPLDCLMHIKVEDVLKEVENMLKTKRKFHEVS
jgi:heptosyltransferase-2